MTDSDREIRRRRRAHRLIRRAIRFLERAHGWRIQFLPIGDEEDPSARIRIGFEPEEVIVGAIDPSAKMIYVDPGYPDLMGVLLHECMHAVFPEAREEEILRLERLVRKHLTSRQTRDFLKIVAFRLI